WLQFEVGCDPRQDYAGPASGEIVADGRVWQPSEHRGASPVSIMTPLRPLAFAWYNAASTRLSQLIQLSLGANRAPPSEAVTGPPGLFNSDWMRLRISSATALIPETSVPAKSSTNSSPPKRNK